MAVMNAPNRLTQIRILIAVAVAIFTEVNSFSGVASTKPHPRFRLSAQSRSDEFCPFTDETKISGLRSTAHLAGAACALIAFVGPADAMGNTEIADILSHPSPVVFDEKILINGLISGAAINAAKNLILHPIETVKTRLDTGEREMSALVADVYSGIVPALVGGVPAAAVFFGAKDLIRDSLRHAGVSPGPATILSVTLASFPYWALRNPSEVIKTRLRTGAAASASFTDIVFQGQISDLYSGLTSNLLYSLPSDWLKFIFYEYFSGALFGLQEGQSVDGFAAIICGSLGALVAETLCTPLDVARTRIMCMSKEPELLQSTINVLALAGEERLDVDIGPTDDETTRPGARAVAGARAGASPVITAYTGPPGEQLQSDEPDPLVLARAGSSKPNPLLVIWDIIRKEKLSNLFAGNIRMCLPLESFKSWEHRAHFPLLLCVSCTDLACMFPLSIYCRWSTALSQSPSRWRSSVLCVRDNSKYTALSELLTTPICL
jgi:solute carrier family 25 (mitochondrial S-adenosylmethionine transporter), member 26